MLNKMALAFSLLVSSNYLYSTSKVYVYRNADGVLVFSDKPHPGAEEISPKSKIESIPAVNTSLDSSNTRSANNDKQVEYTVKVIQPQDKATIRDNTGAVYVATQVVPTYQADMKVRLLLDGQEAMPPQSRSVFMLKNVYRGEHTLKIELIDSNGKVIASSKPRTFYMHRASVITPK
ncbi:DUF4124 domain-containing protein [Catenovulum sediminis]|uniref:DUF4124 domain-containing protein n=1 Tax=Catenovulum sediminis TaxID=1740262 RepID=UPI00117EF02C|nr:DUF4124 domain-containing protein [Catenovulum sediminis]